MIPNKLYIPTSTLNFNNIMSSESISPAAFYLARGFGYRRFEKVDPNNLDYRIILYEKLPAFDINDNELENYPLIIEIDTGTIDGNIIHESKEGVYYSDETIYLNPFTTKFFFGNEEQRRSTLSKAEPSIETKMVAIYDGCFSIKKGDSEWENKYITEAPTHIERYISKDRKINKLKGILLSYLLGANKSLSNEAVSLKKHTKELKNLLSAIITSPDGRASYKQEEQLSILYKQLNYNLFKAEGLDKKIQNIITLKQEQYNCGNFADILKNEGLFDIWRNKQNVKSSYQITPFLLAPKSSVDKKQRALHEYISGIETIVNRFTASKTAGGEDMPVIQHCNRVGTIPGQKEFLSKLLNEYLSEAYNGSEFLHSRYDFAFSGGKLFKEELNEKWEGSGYQVYINALLKNLKEYTPFELNRTDNLNLKSFAAFCQKGDIDIDKLEDYLISNEIGDFRIAFAIWGCVFGFANMPKTLTNSLFLSNDLQYVSEIYKYIYKQVHNIDLQGIIEKKQEIKYISKESRMNELYDVQSYLPDSFSIYDNNSLQIATDLYEKLEQKYKTVAPDKEKYINYFAEYGKTPRLIEFLKNDKQLNKKKGAPKTVISWIEKEITPKKVKSNSRKKAATASTLEFEFTPTKFYLDNNAWSYIEGLPYGDNTIKKTVKEEIEWIQKVHKNGGYTTKSGEWKPSIDHSDKEVISHFENNAKRKIESGLLSQIVRKLKEVYLLNER